MDYKALAIWALGRSTGASAKCIARHMMGLETDGSYPSDGGDFGRCERLLDAVPEFRARLPEMAAVNSRWAALIPRWDEIWASDDKCRLIQSIVRQPENADKGHIRLGDGVSIQFGRPTRPPPPPEKRAGCAREETMMPKFRKKPVEIEAVQLPQECFTGAPVAAASAMDRFEETAEIFSGGKWRNWKWRGGQKPGLVIPTLEGDHLAEPGDWIIKGVKGEFYPCKPDIFAVTYEPAPSGDE